MARRLFAGPAFALVWALCLYVLCVETYYYIFSPDYQGFYVGLYFLYNAVLFSGLYCVARRRGLGWLPVGLLGSTILAWTGLVLFDLGLFGTQSPRRATAWFNNPNQLGYYATCLLSLVYLVYRESRLSMLAVLPWLAAAFILACFSLSKAAIVASLACLPLMLKPYGTRAGKLHWAFAVAVAAAVLGSLYYAGLFDDYAVVERITGMAREDDSSLSARGYLAYRSASAWQLIFGQGYWSVIGRLGNEVHSTLAGLFINYGLLALLLFGALVVHWLRLTREAYGLAGMISIAGPALLYGLTHNGIRFSLFWVLLSVSFAAAENRLAAGGYARRPAPAGSSALRDAPRASGPSHAGAGLP
ncbi:MAG: hypothetical protein ACX93N_09790 [Pseudohaliea sp.]